MSAARAAWPRPGAANATWPASICSTRRPACTTATFSPTALELVPGYRRLQGIVFRRGDARFAGRRPPQAALAAALADPDCLMVNRNAGSGTRILIDRLLGGRASRRATGRRPNPTTRSPRPSPRAAPTGAWRSRPWPAAYGLGFLPLQPEHYDFLVPTARRDRPPVVRFIELLADPAVRSGLADMGFSV